VAFDPDPRPVTKKRPKKKRKPLPPPPPPTSRRSIEAPGSSSRVSNPTGLRQYSFVRANAGVDWRHVQPALLQTLNALGRKTGKIITLTSGFRTRAEQARLYAAYLRGEIGLAAPPGSSNHEHGDAVDALVDGQPIASAIPEATLNSVGLQSLAHANDPVHVELSGGRSSGAVTSQSDAPAAQQPMAPSGYAPVETPQYTGAPMAAPEATADLLPFELEETPEHTILSAQQRAETWQLIAEQPGASPEAQALARIARLSAGR
jgi:hypothetical protein